MLITNFAAFLYLALAPSANIVAVARPFPLSSLRDNTPPSAAPDAFSVHYHREVLDDNNSYSSGDLDDSSDLANGTTDVTSNGEVYPDEDSNDDSTWTSANYDSSRRRRGIIAKRERTRSRRHDKYATSHSGKRRLNPGLERRQLGNLVSSTNLVSNTLNSLGVNDISRAAVGLNNNPITGGGVLPTIQRIPQVNVTTNSVAPALRVNPLANVVQAVGVGN